MKPDAFIRRWGIGCFYHFTDERNLPSIRASGGLLSLAELRRRSIDVTAPGGNDWSHEADEHFGLDDYVHLCLLNEHPMEYRARQEGRVERTRFLEIEPDILLVAGVRLSPGVANKSDVPILTLEDAVEQMDFEVIYERTNWRDPAIQERRRAAKKYEILIPGSIPLAKIRGL